MTFLLDEFANVALPDDFCSLLSTMRSREISSVIIIQNLAQIKALFKDTWETITGNCDTTVYLGGNEQSTHEYISKLLGKMTIDKKSSGETKGRQGSSSHNIDVLGREILTPDEVRMMDNKKCLVFIRGQNPVMDNKYYTPGHPRFSQSADGGGDAYIFTPKTADNLLDIPYAILTPEGFLQYEKRKEKGEKVFIDTMTYEEFMMLGDVDMEAHFMEMDQAEAEQEYRSTEDGAAELAYTPDEETEVSMVAELIALRKQAMSKNKSDTGQAWEDEEPVNVSDENNSDDSLYIRLEHLAFTPAQRLEIKRAQEERIPEAYILTYAMPENSVVKMAAMRRKYGKSEDSNSRGKGAA